MSNPASAHSALLVRCSLVCAALSIMACQRGPESPPSAEPDSAGQPPSVTVPEPTAAPGDPAAPPGAPSDPPGTPAAPPAEPTPAPPTASGDAGSGACRSDADCRVFSDYCTGCDCRALAQGAPEPTCSGPGVRCLVDPCDRKAAVCRSGRCVIEAR